MLSKLLKQLNFTDNEAKVYLTLFDLGPSKATKIIDSIGLHRNLVYTSLEKLEKRHLVIKVLVKGVAEFSVSDPQILLEELDQQKELAKQAVEELTKKQDHETRDIQIFEGLEGIKRARNRILTLPSNSDFYVLGATKLTSFPELEAFWRKFHKEREDKGINQKMLYDFSNDSNTKEQMKWRNALPRTEAKQLPFRIDTPFWFDFAEDMINVGFIGKAPLTISIKSKTLANGLKQYFNFFWNQKVTTTTGIEAVKNAFDNMLDELNPKEEYKVFGALGQNYPKGLSEYFDDYHRTRIKKNVTVKMLCYQDSYDSLKKRFIQQGDPEGKISHLKKYTNAPLVPMQINLYNNKSFFVIYEEEPIVIHFDTPSIHDTFNNYFEDAWNQEFSSSSDPKVLQELWLEAIEAKEMRFIGARGYFMDQYPELFKAVEEKARKTKDIKWQIVVDKGTQGHKLTKFPWAHVKYTQKVVKNPNVVWLFGNKVLIVNWSENKPYIIISENKHLKQTYENYFEELWKL